MTLLVLGLMFALGTCWFMFTSVRNVVLNMIALHKAIEDEVYELRRLTQEQKNTTTYIHGLIRTLDSKIREGK